MEAPAGVRPGRLPPRSILAPTPVSHSHMKLRPLVAAAAALLLLAGGVAWFTNRFEPSFSPTSADPAPAPAERAAFGHSLPFPTPVAPPPAPEEGAAAALEGSVLDALTGAGVEGAELTFS